ncbi:hypothetical protein PN419_17965 [Halorubrum ezzemoulense]|uniref:hypothetical protein n=1 Tax=Halorubrum ezzemoulense TaxID=337243 RepID=UPI00233023F1|nr:hypothetical protein [Halorubrum ezzemoulense]MDB9250857.1 hypothetical protein [Halorubrum ezzemoulense]MDB9261028.1 hypothetical protein [Halorubrum ezzemoulense]MDB9264420.1 hypothetical protein [Halorubrum ezzemoulense]MDB9267905.1 hypothetical protein [Halorubrum ezzemoulense]MDB9271389.1 hypothetical protein [Halorubrum ezzemoulense]
MSDDTAPENDAQDAVQDDGSDDEGNTLSRDNIPETAHITACGTVISDDGERLGKVEVRGDVSFPSEGWGSDGETSVLTSLHERTVGYVDVEAVEDLHGDETTKGDR